MQHRGRRVAGRILLQLPLLLGSRGCGGRRLSGNGGIVGGTAVLIVRELIQHLLRRNHGLLFLHLLVRLLLLRLHHCSLLLAAVCSPSAAGLDCLCTGVRASLDRAAKISSTGGSWSAAAASSRPLARECSRIALGGSSSSSSFASFEAPFSFTSPISLAPGAAFDFAAPFPSVGVASRCGSGVVTVVVKRPSVRRKVSTERFDVVTGAVAKEEEEEEEEGGKTGGGGRGGRGRRRLSLTARRFVADFLSKGVLLDGTKVGGGARST